MHDLNLWEATGLSIAFLMLIFVPMEKVFPAKKGQRFFRPHWMLDLCFLLGQYLLWSSLVIWALDFFSIYLIKII